MNEYKLKTILIITNLTQYFQHQKGHVISLPPLERMLLHLATHMVSSLFGSLFCTCNYSSVSFLFNLHFWPFPSLIFHSVSLSSSSVPKCDTTGQTGCQSRHYTAAVRLKNATHQRLKEKEAAVGRVWTVLLYKLSLSCKAKLWVDNFSVTILSNIL